ncbi:hypothetical protein AYL99_05521 [Fonsecaea erecta]|uniref:Uncharacterized protein n=1 Tax=Fonsecaea erecta TaxID=1367422 RepID=A0A178ZL48_9EURO|nr:hypothetical protein AYL99_05521 [Fonsecaea erecta]OAP60519.1 hypothetical protein AYL99_05521 [Fonsecaea erecta]
MTDIALLDAVLSEVTAEVINTVLRRNPVTTTLFNLGESCIDQPYCNHLYTTFNPAKDPTGYAAWYQRSVVNGRADEVKVEVILLAKGKAGDEDNVMFERELTDAGKGGEPAKSTLAPYIRLRKTKEVQRTTPSLEERMSTRTKTTKRKTTTQR